MKAQAATKNKAKDQKKSLKESELKIIPEAWEDQINSNDYLGRKLSVPETSMPHSLLPVSRRAYARENKRETGSRAKKPAQGTND